MTTVTLIAKCNAKLKNYKKAHQFIDQAEKYAVTTFGDKSKEVARLKI